MGHNFLNIYLQMVYLQTNVYSQSVSPNESINDTEFSRSKNLNGFHKVFANIKLLESINTVLNNAA